MKTPNFDSFPSSSDEILEIQRIQKRIAVERAKQAPFFDNKLEHIDLNKLEEPEEWAKIPILDKEQLRSIPEKEFLNSFCLAKKNEICEYWRSGGSTGRPLFYPRTFEDLHYSSISFARSYYFFGIQAGQQVHNSFPLGIHPAGQIMARAAHLMNVGVTWAGGGNSTPSELQLELLELLQPDVWMGLPSYGMHLLNLAEAQGQSLKLEGRQRKIITSAEPLSSSKRERLESGWGAKVYDCFGMTEACLLAAESDAQDGLHFWTDFAYLEVLDVDTLQPVAEGEVGLLVVTPLFTNNATPFLRWNSGDLVTYSPAKNDGSAFGAYPVIKHSQRTEGFFKIRGVNINHSDFEELLRAQAGVREFRLEAYNDGGLDQLKLSVEVDPQVNTEELTNSLSNAISATFEQRCEIHIAQLGEIASELQKSIKPVRFIDSRNS